ncbi:hypothetical protein OAO55_00720 [Bacteroidales bacterium]|nr:hypothetical protein [Bacteroidales bacterium]
MFKITDTIKLISKTLLTDLIPVAGLFIFGYTMNNNNLELDSYTRSSISNDVTTLPIINNASFNHNMPNEKNGSVDLSLNVMVNNKAENFEYASIDTEEKTNPYNITINLTLPTDN